MATQANASLTSNRSTSATLQPALSSTFWIAGTGAEVNFSGSCACAACATTRAIGCLPSFCATLSRVSTSAAAPSLIDELVAAVIVPSFAKAALSCGILSGLPLPGCFVGVDCDFALAGHDRTGDDLLVELAVGDRLVRAAKALDRIIVLLLTRELIFARRASSAKVPIARPLS